MIERFVLGAGLLLMNKLFSDSEPDTTDTKSWPRLARFIGDNNEDLHGYVGETGVSAAILPRNTVILVRQSINESFDFRWAATRTGHPPIFHYGFKPEWLDFNNID